ncbi:PREDICTED: ubiquinol oxidase 2, mitochondrial [Populus euphratica]|uniref:Ubiquinol oxidase n=3 Tax=Populus TaxID=3689 RepID=A0AAJ6UER6_POPEU|nr:PREDICTED: ubiquinol oxidase 2, mitochondrial [Populus euphratica]XP_011028024.1 PREDICTED: ubiquinol oxidase 2, mitochondrial [Populus euphratica]
MSQSAATKVSRLLLGQLGPRFLSTTTSFSRPATSGMSSTRFASYGVRGWSASAPPVMPSEEEKPKAAANSFTTEDGKAIVSYWGVTPPKIVKEDGTAWKWNCFRPWESYKPDISIDVTKHHKPGTTMDKFAYWTVQVLKYPTYLFFQRRHMCHAMLLETVAAVPGMVGGMLLHCKSLRRFEQSGGWIKALLEEAENERMHLMTFIEIAKPQWYERALVFAVQGVFFNAYFLAYLASPKLAHRIVGYLEEEAVNSYSEFLKDLDNGSFENVPAPAIAIDYWRLPPNSTLRDVVFVIRADEAHHRDLNHYASDIQCQGQELKDTPAPIGYH